MAQFAPDRFDEFPHDVPRVGAHRAPAPRGRGWIAVAWAALASGLLVLVGLYALSLISDRVSFELPGFGTASPAPTESSAPEPSATPTVEAITDPALATLPEGFAITVLNGTGVSGVGRAAADVLEAPGWPVGTVTSAAQDDLVETVVYYSDPALEPVARGMVALLAVGDIELSTAFPGAPITIAIGADFTERVP